jgi:predicted negative regulator of RcsB-dependent stress response
MSSSKIDHKELEKRLKEDELEVFLSEFKKTSLSLYERYGTQTFMAIAALAVAFLLYNFWNGQSEKSYQEAQLQYANASILIDDKKYDEALSPLNSLIEQFSSMPIATLGRVLRANCYIKSGQIDKAIEDYRYAIPKLAEIDSIPVRFSLVQSLRSAGKPDEALQELDGLDGIVQSDSLKEQISFLRAACHEDKGNVDEALKLYESIKPESSWYSMAGERMEWIQSQSVKPIN